MNAFALGGVAGILIGVALAVVGLSTAIDAGEAIRGDAVATGALGEPLRFSAPAGQKLTVYLDVPGFADQDSAASATRCAVRGDGFEDAFSGARQGVSTTIGSYVSVGSFTSPGGALRLECAGSDAALVVTPGGGGPVVTGILVLVGGVLLAGLGVALLIIGTLRQRRAGRSAPPPAAPPR